MLMLYVRKEMEGQQKGLHLPGKVAACRLKAERLGTPYDSQCCHSEALGSSKPEQMCPGRPDTGPGERLDLAEALLEVSSAALASWPQSSCENGVNNRKSPGGVVLLCAFLLEDPRLHPGAEELVLFYPKQRSPVKMNHFVSFIESLKWEMISKIWSNHPPATDFTH